MKTLIRASSRTALLVVFLGLIGRMEAGPLTEARVNKIINQVTVLDPGSGAHPASLHEVIKDEIGLKTGIKSRSELLFQDNTLTRIGPESFFSFKPGTREMALKEGSMLLQVPKGIGGAKIRTAAVTASITGTTIMMEYHPKKSIKVLVLEGSLRLSVNGRFGDSLLLLPGKMVIMHPDDRRIPDPVSVDIATITRTSSLVQMPAAEGEVASALPSMDLIEKEIEKQAEQKTDNHLLNTNLVILGSGTNVVMASDSVIDTLDRKKEADAILLASNTNGSGGTGSNGSPGAGGGAGGGGGDSTPTEPPTSTPAPTATPAGTPVPDPSATPSPDPSATPSPTATPSATPLPTPAGSPIAITSTGDLIITTPITASEVQLSAGRKLLIQAPITTGTLNFDAGYTSQIDSLITASVLTGRVLGDLQITTSLNVDDITLDLAGNLSYTTALVAPARGGTLLGAPSDGRRFTLFANTLNLSVASGSVVPLILNGGDALPLSPFGGGSGGILNIGTDARPISGQVTISAPVFATTGRNGATVAYGGDGGQVNIVSNDKVTVTDQIKVSDSAPGYASRKGGNIAINSRKTSATAIDIRSSAQLLALLSNAAPGPGGSIKLTSAGGEIKMAGTAKADRGTVEITNSGNAGLVTLTGATLHGDVVKIGALGNNGTLVVDGGNISADSAIKLYAGGSNGSVLFKDNVTLSGTSVKTIYGQTVTVANNKIVTVLGPGPANVFTNVPNYSGFGGNGSTTGTFAGQGATTQPLSAGPGY